MKKQIIVRRRIDFVDLIFVCLIEIIPRWCMVEELTAYCAGLGVELETNLHNHGEGSYLGLLFVESGYYCFQI